MKKSVGLTLAAMCLVVCGLMPARLACGQNEANTAPAAQGTAESAPPAAFGTADAANQATSEATAPVAIQGTDTLAAVQPTPGAIQPVPESAKPDDPAKKDSAKKDKAEQTPEQVFKGLDNDGDQQLTITEYVGGKGGVEKIELTEQFQKWDGDNSGKLTLTEYTVGLASLTPWYKAWYTVLGIVALVVLVSLAFGAWMGPLVRMPEANWKFTVVALSVLLALVLMWLRWPPKLGIDLNGGTILAYELDKSDRAALAQGVSSEELMKRMIAAITKRVDPAGVKQITIRSIGIRNDAIEVIVPETDPTEVAALKRILQTQGHLEFRILAHDVENADLVEQAKNVAWKVEDENQDAVRSSKAEKVSYLIDNADKMEKQRLAAVAEATKSGKEPPPAETIILLDDRPAAEWMDVPAKDEKTAEANKDLVTRNLDGKVQKLVILGEVKARWVPVGKDESGNVRVSLQDAVWRPSRSGEGVDVLVVTDMQNVVGKYLKSARAGMSNDGGFAVKFAFDSAGARLFGTLTGDNVPKGDLTRMLGIILDDELLSAPALRSRISDEGEITGRFTKREVDWLVGVLDAGSLPAKLNPTPIRETIVDPTLGAETIRKGELAILISLVIVPIAMTLYYRFAGFVAGIAVLLNLLLVVAVMVGVQAAFTLAGLAGLMLTVGMSVDANVLIYERIREELERGAALRMAIRNGFSRATRTIIDSNATNIITAVVLYTVGTEQLKGFAVTLILGILMSMFTAIFCARLVFDICEKNRWITTLRMTKMIGETNVNFVGAIRYCIAGSLALIAIGMVAVFLRGTDFLDIDFSGGTKIEMVFKQPHQQQAVQKRLDEYNDNPAIAKDARLDAVFASGIGERTPKGNLNFSVETVQADPKVVQDALKHVFAGELKTNRLTFDEAQFVSIPGTAAPAEATDVPAKTPAVAPAAPVQPTGEAPAEKKPDDANKPATDKPAAGDGAQRATPAARMPALALDPQILFVGQPAPDIQSTGTPSPAPAVQPTSDSTLPAAQPTGSRPTAAQDANNTSAAGQGSTASIHPFAGGTMAELTFEDKTKQSVLKEMIQQAGRAVGLVKIAKSGEAIPEERDGAKDRPVELSFQFQVSNMAVIGDSQLPVHSWTLTTTLDKPNTLKLLTELQRRMADEPVYPMAENVGNQVAGAMQRSAFMAVFISFLAIIGYLWVRFQHARYGLAAVVALMHDVLVTVGLLALSRYMLFIPTMESFKMNLVILAAVLTLIGYSLNDTIVIFDRIRELKGKSPHINKGLVNAAVNQTLSRTLLTSLLTFVVVGVLYFVGGPGVKGFSFTLLIGIIVGTYSSIYIAAPVLLWMEGTGAVEPPRTPRSSDKTAAPTAG